MSHPSRSSESRAAEQRASIGAVVTTRGIDLSGIPDDLEPVWVRETIIGMKDVRNVSDALKRGYKPATYSEYTSAARPLDLPGAEPPKDDIIRDGSDVLMLRPKDMAEQEQQAARDLSAAHIRSVQRVGNDPEAKLDQENFVENSEVQDSKAPRRSPKPRFPE